MHINMYIIMNKVSMIGIKNRNTLINYFMQINVAIEIHNISFKNVVEVFLSRSSITNITITCNMQKLILQINCVLSSFICLK